MDKLQSIAIDYIVHQRPNAEKELRWFAIQKSLSDAAEQYRSTL